MNGEQQQPTPQRPERILGEYFNGFEVGLGPGDVVITLVRNNERRVLVNCTLTIARALSEALHDAVSAMENATGKPAPTLPELVAARQVLDAARKVKENEPQ